MGNWFTRDSIKIYELEREVAALRQLNEELRQQIASSVGPNVSHLKMLKTVGGALPQDRTPIKVSGISHEKLMAWVDDQLKNKDSNSKWIPDFAERKLKTEIFEMILGIVEHALATTKIEVMGHVIRFDLTQE